MSYAHFCLSLSKLQGSILRFSVMYADHLAPSQVSMLSLEILLVKLSIAGIEQESKPILKS